MRRGIGYLRVSSQGQESGLGLDAQAAKVREYATTHNIELLELVRETASGGVKQGEVFSYEHRPALVHIMDRADQFDVLIVARFDRLSRDPATLVAVKRRLQNAGVELASVAEENGDSPQAKMMQGILAVLAEYEAALILERTSYGRAQKKDRGGMIGGSVPYGYKSRPGDKGTQLVIHEPAASIVRRIYDDARQGLTPGKITNALNTEGEPSPTGKTWNRTTVRGIITNPIYKGELHGQRKQPTIVTTRRWNEANKALAARSRG